MCGWNPGVLQHKTFKFLFKHMHIQSALSHKSMRNMPVLIKPLSDAVPREGKTYLCLVLYLYLLLYQNNIIVQFTFSFKVTPKTAPDLVLLVDFADLYREWAILVPQGKCLPKAVWAGLTGSCTWSNSNCFCHPIFLSTWEALANLYLFAKCCHVGKKMLWQ